MHIGYAGNPKHKAKIVNCKGTIVIEELKKKGGEKNMHIPICAMLARCVCTDRRKT